MAGLMAYATSSREFTTLSSGRADVTAAWWVAEHSQKLQHQGKGILLSALSLPGGNITQLSAARRRSAKEPAV